MNTSTADNDRIAKTINAVTGELSRDPLCLEIRHYPAAQELAGSEKLHLLIIMQRELKQSERRERVEQLKQIASSQGLDVDVIFSSPEVWRDLITLVGPFTRVQNESIIDWQRGNDSRKSA